MILCCYIQLISRWYMNTINAGSFSRLDIFTQCPQRAKLAYIDKIPEPDRGPGPLTAPDGTLEWHNDRGSRIHDLAEKYVKREIDFFPNELNKFSDDFKRMRSYADSGQVILEKMWCFDSEWIPCAIDDFNLIYFRMITDATVFLTPRTAIVIDYKTGRKFGNEIKHGQQAQLYQLGAFLRFPDLEEVTTEIWYLDQDELSTQEFTRDQGMRFLKGWQKKMEGLTNEIRFSPKPNMVSCRWCPYRPGRSGDCSVGIPL